jgi:hypothetical protein
MIGGRRAADLANPCLTRAAPWTLHVRRAAARQVTVAVAAIAVAPLTEFAVRMAHKLCLERPRMSFRMGKHDIAN